jgi:hypothetical protein
MRLYLLFLVSLVPVLVQAQIIWNKDGISYTYSEPVVDTVTDVSSPGHANFFNSTMAIASCR